MTPHTDIWIPWKYLSKNKLLSTFWPQMQTNKKKKKFWHHSSSTAPHFNRVYTYYILYICVSGTFRKKQAPQQYLMLLSWVQNEIPTYWLEQPSGNINVIFQMRNPFLFSACIPPVDSWAVAYSLIWTLEMLKQL